MSIFDSAIFDSVIFDTGEDVSTKVGGDDVPRRRKSPHKGFDLEAWKARQPDFEGTIRSAYENLMRGPVAEEALDIVAPHLETDTQEHEIDWQSLFADYRAISELIQLHEAQVREEEAIVSLLIH